MTKSNHRLEEPGCSLMTPNQTGGEDGTQPGQTRKTGGRRVWGRSGCEPSFPRSSSKKSPFHWEWSGLNG